MTNTAEIVIILLAGIYICVLRYPIAVNASALFDLLFQNTQSFNRYNMSTFDAVHLIWFLLFMLVLIRNSMRKINDSKGLLEMELYRSSFRSVFRQALMISASFNLLSLLTVGTVNTAVCIVLLKSTDALYLLANEIIYYCKLFFLLMFMCSCYLILMFLQSSSVGLYFCNIAAVVLTLTDLICGSSWISYSDHAGTNVVYLCVSVAAFSLVLSVSEFIFRKGKDIQ